MTARCSNRAVHQTQPDGLIKILVAYEISAYDACVTGATHVERGFRTGEEYDRRRRELSVFDEGGQAQIVLALGEWGLTDDLTATTSAAARWRLRDTNSDGRSDLVVDRFEYEDFGECPTTADGWFQPVGEPGDMCEGTIEQTVFVYRPERDYWID